MTKRHKKQRQSLYLLKHPSKMWYCGYRETVFRNRRVQWERREMPLHCKKSTEIRNNNSRAFTSWFLWTRRQEIHIFYSVSFLTVEKISWKIWIKCILQKKINRDIITGFVLSACRNHGDCAEIDRCIGKGQQGKCKLKQGMHHQQ